MRQVCRQKGSWGQEKPAPVSCNKIGKSMQHPATLEQSARFRAALDDFQQRLASFEDVESRVAPIRASRYIECR